MSVDLGEFKFIDSVLKKSLPMGEFAPERRGWLPVGDDCAMFDGWLVTKDLSVEGTHFRMDWSSPEQAVEKHIVSNVSDISAMGPKNPRRQLTCPYFLHYPKPLPSPQQRARSSRRESHEFLLQRDE